MQALLGVEDFYLSAVRFWLVNFDRRHHLASSGARGVNVLLEQQQLRRADGPHPDMAKCY